jgi:hypothetical protein
MMIRMKFLRIRGLKGAFTMLFHLLDQSSTRRVLKLLLKTVASERMQKYLIQKYISCRVKLEWKSINQNRRKETIKRINAFENDPETKEIFRLLRNSGREP